MVNIIGYYISFKLLLHIVGIHQNVLLVIHTLFNTFQATKYMHFMMACFIEQTNTNTLDYNKLIYRCIRVPLGTRIV